ncbi:MULTISPECIES: flavin reductase family protein [Paraburkholderia]|uniref:flavin reductase family protein n=1 Tax=Paraburkholderia TaxID=1822464 RepID=UPI0018D65461|nr:MULTISPECIES: flavin reductase family protein [Paraburkholderia]MDR8397117.1 flavin reductase family protein [Paraburkholderia sp. USG1]
MLADIERITHPLELAASFKSAMSRGASSVALVTTVDENGRPHGLATTTFLSVSMNPASALICVNRSASASPVIKDSGVFCVVLLQSIHEEISARFSRPDNRDQRFVQGRWRAGPAGLPYIDDAPAVFCSVA